MSVFFKVTASVEPTGNNVDGGMTTESLISRAFKILANILGSLGPKQAQELISQVVALLREQGGKVFICIKKNVYI